MAPVHSKLAASARAAAQQLGKYEHKPQSYRVVLSDEGLMDVGIEVTEIVKKKDDGGMMDVLVIVFSKAAFAKTNKKQPITFFLPEMAVNWSNMHTVGEVFKEDGENVLKRKRRVILQTKWEEEEDGKINEQVQKLADHARPYDDINEEVRWVIQQLNKLDRMIIKAILSHEKALVKDNVRVNLIMDARRKVAIARGVGPGDVTSADPDVLDAAVDLFWNNLIKAKPIKQSERLSVKDTCPAGADCMQDECTNPEHVRGEKQYTISLQASFFGQKEFDEDYTPDPMPFTDVLSRWVSEHPGKTVADAKGLDKKAELDQLTYDMVLENDRLQYNPAFYRTRKNGTLEMSKKQAAELAAEGKPPQFYYTAPHPKIIGFGTTARFLVTVRGASAPGVNGGVGMRLHFNPVNVAIFRQQKLSYTGLEADAMVGDDEDLEIIPGGWVPPVATADPMAVDATSSSYVAPEESGSKRKREDGDDGSRKAAKTEASE